MSTTQQTTNVMDVIITEHNTAFGIMTQHFGDYNKVRIVTDFMLKCTGYYINGKLIRFINRPTERQLSRLQQNAYLFHTSMS